MGLFNSTPAIEFFAETMKPFTSYKRNITIASADVATGEYVRFKDTDTSL